MMWQILSLALLLASYAEAKELLLAPDIRSKASSGAGLYYSSGPSSLFHNPANLERRQGSELTAEVSLGKINFSYSPANDSPGGGIAVVAPPVFFGGAWEGPLGIRFGAGLIPKGTGQTSTIDKLPINVQGSNIIVKAKVKDKSFRYGLGAAKKPLEGLRVGASLIGDVDDVQTSVFGDANEPTVTIKNHGSFSRLAFGGNYLINSKWAVAAGYVSPMVKLYKGEIRLYKDLGQATTSAAGFLPSESKLGIQFHISSITLDLEYVYMRYGNGRTLRRTGLSSSDGVERDLVNTHNIHLASSFSSGHETYIAGFAYLPSSVGYGKFKGTAPSDGKSQEVQITGIQLGEDFDYVNQSVISGGVLHRIDARTELGFYSTYVYGRKDVPVFAPNPGRYRLNSIQLGFGTDYKM